MDDGYTIVRDSINEEVATVVRAGRSGQAHRGDKN